MGKLMTFMEHIHELQKCLKKVIGLIFFEFIFFFTFGFKEFYIRGTRLVYPYPTLENSFSAALFRRMWDYLVPTNLNGVEIQPYASLGGGIMLLVIMSLFLAITFSMPMTLWQFSKFVRPALKKREKKVIVKTIIPATILFLGGCAFAFFLLIPFTIHFLLQVIVGLDATALITVDDFMKFVILFTLAFGIVFELPIVMYGLTRIGVVESKFWLRNWRYAFIIMILFGGIITPDGSGITQLMIAIPMLGLYFIGYFAGRSHELEQHPRRDKSSKRKILTGIVALTIIVSFVLAVIVIPNDSNDFIDESEDMPKLPWLQALEWNPNGDYGLLVGEGNCIVKWDGITGKDTPVGVSYFQAGPVVPGFSSKLLNMTNDTNYYDITWHPSGDYALICGSNGTILKYDGTNLTDLSLELDDDFQAIKFLPNGQYAIAVGTNGLIGKIEAGLVNYSYVPDSIIKDVSFYDLDWDGIGKNALMVGYDPNNFIRGIMIKFTPDENDTLNASYSVISSSLSPTTCFSSLWTEKWNCFIVTCGDGEIWKVREDWAISKLNNPYSDSDPIIDSMWLPNEEKVLLVGGLSGWNSIEGEYKLDQSSKIVLKLDVDNISLIHEDKGPNFLSCGWNPTNDTAVLIGSFGIVYEYSNDTVTELSIDYFN